MSSVTASVNPWPARWQRLSAAFLRAFHRYASWLVSISWKRFLLLSLLLLICASILPNLPPFSWSVTETIEDSRPREPGSAPAPKVPKAPPLPPSPPKAEKPPREPVIKIERPASGAGAAEGLDISIDERGIRVKPRMKPGAASAAATASAAAATAASAAEAAVDAARVADAGNSVTITLPPGVNKEALREAVEEARRGIEEAIEAKREAAEAAAETAREEQRAAKEAERAAREAMAEASGAVIGPSGKIKRTRKVRWGDFLTDLAVLWVMGSVIIKATYKGRMQAEVKAAQATETAEAESLKRQVVEARMAAMQAQVEPHFLFNTLASIDHLIETDPQRASQMQKHLIALLRASMPTMREASGNGTGRESGQRDLARELSVIRPYLEILKVRMEERLSTRIEVPDGLLSAEFPPMMVQTLVENAIKHGLEPKAEGGELLVAAEIVHGKLQVKVADTGLGFGRAATAGTGVGLANIRERLQLLHGTRASLSVAENPGGGTVVTVTVPYRSLEGEAA